MKKLTYLLICLSFLTACTGKTSQTEKQNNVKYETYHNERYGYSLEYPDFLIPQGVADNGDGQKFFSEDQKIQLFVYYEYKINIMEGGELYSIGGAYKEDLNSKDGIFNTKLEGQHYIIEYKMDDLLHTDYATLIGESYFNIRFQYPEKEKEIMKGVIEHVINSFSVKGYENKLSESEDNVSGGGEEDMFLVFLEGFLKDCYWGKNFNTQLRNQDKTLSTYIDPKMDVRRYYAPGTVAKLGTRDKDFGFAQEDDFVNKPETQGKLIFEYTFPETNPCELFYNELNDETYIIYYQYIKSVPDVVVNNETFETKPVKIAYPNAEKRAVYLPNSYGNPRGFYFINTPNGWKLAFVDDSLCEA